MSGEKELKKREATGRQGEQHPEKKEEQSPEKAAAKREQGKGSKEKEAGKGRREKRARKRAQGT